MLRISNVTLRRGARVLLDDASMNVHPGHKVGFVGPNGAGKSSVFALVLNELHADSGEVAYPPRWVLSHVSQETPAVDRPAIEFALDGDVELREIEAAIAAAEASHEEGEELAHLHSRFEEIGGYQARSRAQSMLGGLGFDAEAQARPVASFSGGWRMRLNLARALMCRADLLLLDEPTNHLDLDAVMWLEDWLKAYAGAVLLITHDREFLDTVAQSIVHIENRKLNTYAGNYSAFETQRADRLALQQASYEKQQKSIAHLEAFIARFRAKATKAAQAQSRIKALEKLERIAAAHVDSPFTFTFREPAEKPRTLFRLEEANLGYGTKAVLSGIEWSVMLGDAIGLLGPNGAGKSTLLKSVVGNLPLLSGELQRAQGLRVGYFAQHQVDQLRLEESALWHLGHIAPGVREQELRDFLGGFDFRGDQVMQASASLSGGEKARLALALIVWQRPNLLLLDEPTNHLDIEMRESLAQALTDFEGALVVVAHDRALLAAATDQWLLVADGAVVPFDGDLDDYKEWAKAYHARGTQREEKAGVVDRKAERRSQAEARQRTADVRKPFEKKIRAIETELEVLQKESAEAEAWLASGEAYEEAHKDRLKTVLQRRGEVATRIATLEEDWLWQQAALDAEVNRVRE
ncbi:putative ABC transporter ATP-binding protein YheS [Usitatibacter rugosus]|uniref:Probable ATP-binding protein YheS n=1 Tax=Usitatibacter rugosus TaxID=2732067 RepID=A0A6M4H0M5_9PROT|nr:ATP-binding cassette domain-containing protein [Usitatibacter rugosus]QJR13050.1 putative ABC transporter ATP-binding protein YheS [Usitatibacter rugosus]